MASTAPQGPPKALYDKIFDDHVVARQPDGTCILYIDRHLVHEVTSPQAFEGLRLAGRKVRAPEKTLAVVDHNVPTTDRREGIADPESRLQVETLAKNAKDFGIEYYNELDPRQGNLAGVISLSGSLRARPRRDGLVDLDVDTNRMLYGLNTPGSPMPSTVRKTLTLKPEETTAIDFPPPASGYASVALGAGGAGSGGAVVVGPAQGGAPSTSPAVEVRNDRLVVNTAQLFKGHKTQLLITLHKLQ